MLDWANKPYEVHDMSITLTQLISQLLAASLGILALMLICYGVAKLYMNYIINK